MEIRTPILIIGSGIAGLYTALQCAKKSSVILVTKKNTTESNTNYAQGGIASVFSPEDSFEKHIEDTLIAGAGLCNRKMVEILVREGPDHIKTLIDIGTRFTQKNNKLELAREGGHSFARIVHAHDLTGKEVERALNEKVLSDKNITVLENHLAIDLITEHNIRDLRHLPINSRHCFGAYVLDKNKNQILTIIASATILATGGLGQVYLHTTNPTIATGDGYAMAYRAGAKMANMEFIQFHPTALYNQSGFHQESQAFLITEAMRGYGAKLLNVKGERFMQNYDLRLELAPRDIVARAIDSELKKYGDDFVYLDVTHLNSEKTIEKFPNIYKKCFELGIDITKQPIPVVPAAHYACGGIIVDEYGRTTLHGLYAAGEVAMTGVHGANRLASNSLLEALVFSSRCALGIEIDKNYQDQNTPTIPEWDDSGTLTVDEMVLVSHSVKELRQLMWDYVGIVRSNLRLEFAQHRLKNLYEEVENFYKKTKVFERLIELRNLITCSHLIVKCGLLRKENRGLHYSLDYLSSPQEYPARDTIIQNTYQKS